MPKDLFGWDEEHERDLVVKRDARVLRDEALEAVERSNVEWCARFEECVLSYRATSGGGYFTTDDILSHFPDLEECREKRCFGAVMRKLYKSGIVEPGPYRASGRAKSHGRDKRSWRFLDHGE
tara:strand:- start:1231 stop:1599 length:369 start_codon:yes stop_codon:yes gene_type:complete